MSTSQLPSETQFLSQPKPSTALLVPPHTIRIKRARDEAPVSALYVGSTESPTTTTATATTNKRLKTASGPNALNPAYVFRLAHTLPPGIAFQPIDARHGASKALELRDNIINPGVETPLVTPLAPPSRRGTMLQRSDEEETTEKKMKLILDTTATTTKKVAVAVNTKRQGTFGETDRHPSALTPLEMAAPLLDRKRKIAPVRKYQLSKRARTKHPHPYGQNTRSAGAIFERVRNGDEDMADSTVQPEGKEKDVTSDQEQKKERKKPRTHPKEKVQIREAREKGYGITGLQLGYEDDEKLMKDMEKMVLAYLDAEKNDGIHNLPPTSAPKGNEKIGGGVGGGTWAENETKDVNMTDEEDEDGFVYDVYFREEVPAGAGPGEMEVEGQEESYGLIVFAESEDEAWWYEGANEEDDKSDAYGSDDEDSNAEDFHTNDYPDEAVLAEDEEDEYGHDIHDYSEDEIDSSDVEASVRWKPWHPRRIAPGEEEYDLDDSDDDVEPTIRKMVRGVWSID